MQDRFFADLYCGDSLVAEMLTARGVPALSMDMRVPSSVAGPTFVQVDLGSAGLWAQLRQQVRAGRVGGVQAGPECRTFSALRNFLGPGTRSAEFPEGDGSQPEEVEANWHARQVAAMCSDLEEHGSGFLAEQPWPG